jgi:hypothetical protein
MQVAWQIILALLVGGALGAIFGKAIGSAFLEPINMRRGIVLFTLLALIAVCAFIGMGLWVMMFRFV